jgi:hypothetical protein
MVNNCAAFPQHRNGIATLQGILGGGEGRSSAGGENLEMKPSTSMKPKSYRPIDDLRLLQSANNGKRPAENNSWSILIGTKII